MARGRFHLRPLVRYWLRSPGLTGGEDDGAPDPDWAGWVIGRMAAGALLDVGGVFVDRAVLTQRFRCVPERCAPRRGRGRLRSCCADLDVQLSPAEANRLRRHSQRLERWLAPREPRLADALGAEDGSRGPFWLASDGGSLVRLGGRCVFSRLDRRGRIRCHLHRYAQVRGIERQAVQPIPCRLFPLVLLELDSGRVLLTTIHSRTARLVGVPPVSRLPCLADSSHPLLVQSAATDLDWLFGRGFARALREASP